MALQWRQSSQFNKLVEAGMDPRMVEIFRAMFGNCQDDLEHLGTVKFSNTRPPGATDAVVEINEYSNALRYTQDPGANPPVDNQNVLGPFAMHIPFGMVKFGDNVLHGRFWAVAQALWINVAGDDSYVDTFLASDRKGTLVQYQKADGTNTSAKIPLRVYLPRGNSGLDPNVQPGAVLGYMMDPDGVAVMVTPPYLDGVIGSTTQIWQGDPADKPAGWTIQQHVNDHVLRFSSATTGSTQGTLGGTSMGAVSKAEVVGGTTGAFAIGMDDSVTEVREKFVNYLALLRTYT